MFKGIIIGIVISMICDGIAVLIFKHKILPRLKLLKDDSVQCDGQHCSECYCNDSCDYSSTKDKRNNDPCFDCGRTDCLNCNEPNRK